MPSITITDLTNAKLDVDHIAEIANSTETTATDRLGHVKQTITGAVATIAAVTNRGAWAPSTAYALKDVASVSGTWYICIVAHTSSAAFSTDTASKWRVYQGVTTADLALSTASAGVGFIDTPSDSVATTAQARLREIGAGERTAVIPNLGTVANRNCTILGDSISQGAFSINTYLHGWVRIFERCFNAEVGATSYGFVPLLSLGTTVDIHSVSFSGATWVGLESAVDAAAQNYPNGFAMRAGGVGSAITITVPFFQNRATVYYGKQATGGGFTIKVNGVLLATVSSIGATGYGTQTVALTDNGYGDAVILIESTSATDPVDICGVAYLSAAVEPVLNDFSQSGRKLRYVSESVISTLAAESAILIVALGHNDYGSADTDDTYYAAFMQRITWLTTYAIASGTRVVVPDFCWGALRTSRTRIALRKLAADTAGQYIDLPGEIFENRETLTEAQRYTYLVSTLLMWTDGSHPNKYGHQWIAEIIAKRMSLSCTSKRQAIGFHDWWMPLALKSVTAVYNYFPATSDLVSSYKRNGSEILVKLFVRKASTGSFPVGSYLLQDAWRTKSEISAMQGYTGNAVLRDDTSAVVSTIFMSASGAMTIKVLVGTWLNQQDFTFSMPAQIII